MKHRYLGMVAFLLSFSAMADMLSVCERTAPVKAFLESATAKTCDQIIESDLAAIPRVAVPNRKVEEFKVGDFSGLPSLQILNIKGNTFTSLPAGLMAGLPKLKTLVIFRTKLAQLPDDFLEGLDNLENLHIFQNPFTTVPAPVLERLKNMKYLKILDFNAALLPEEQAKLRAIFPDGGQTQLSFE